MNSKNGMDTRLLLIFLSSMILAACTAGNPQFGEQSPAGFWYGLWHGIISVIALIIHIFNDSVLVYETSNTGGWYDFGFLAGVIMIWGGGCHVKCRTREQKQREQEWDEIGDKVEKKVMRKLKAWAEDEQISDDSDDWDEIGEKVEKKIKRKLREWAEKD